MDISLLQCSLYFLLQAIKHTQLSSLLIRKALDWATSVWLYEANTSAVLWLEERANEGVLGLKEETVEE